MSRQKKYTFIDLFAGCGGLSLGLEQAGFEVVFMNEIVETFASTYLANHSLKHGQYFIGDINELNTCLDKYRDTLKNPDRPITLVCGGPPCQGFSMANRQRIIDDPRNQLYKAYLQFLSEIRPQFFIMENVKGMANKFDEIIANFKEYLGDEYLYDYRLLKVQDFGIPQNRERFIMIGNRMGVAPNDIFAENAWYFRNALVRANYTDLQKGIHETTEYLEVFLRNLLLNEKNELHNRNMHISGLLNEEKVDIGDIKRNVESEKVDIQDTKVDIENLLTEKGSNFSVKSIIHIHKLFDEFGFDKIFGRSAVMELLELKSSGASKLLSNLVKSDIIKPVSGHGKGKYKFRKL